MNQFIALKLAQLVRQHPLGGKRDETSQFTESLHMATEAGTDFSGVLCGRATWKEGIPVYAKQGVKALEDWLANEGVKNINAVNDAIKSAKPWFAKVEAAVGV